MRRIFVVMVATLAVALSGCGPAADPEGEVYFKSAARQGTVLPHYEALVRKVFDALTAGRLGTTITYTRAGGVDYPPNCPPPVGTQIGSGHRGPVQICTETGNHSLITEMKDGKYLQSEIIGVRLGDLEVYKGRTDDIVFGQYVVNGKKTGPSVSQKPDQIREADQELIATFRNRVKVYLG